MIEAKLQQAVENLPEPVGEFPVYQKANAPRRFSRKLVLITAMLLTVLIIATGYTYSKVTYGGWAGMYSLDIFEANLRVKKFDLKLPETLQGSPFDHMSEIYVVPTGTPKLVALVNPYYHAYSVWYEIGKEEVIDEKTTHHWSENRIIVSFGTTRQETWKYYFQVFDTDSEKNWAGRSLIPGTYEEVTYEDYTIQMGSYFKDYATGRYYGHCVQYLDGQRQLCIRISADSLDIALAAAKDIIDLNK